MIPPVAETMVFCAFPTNRRDLITGNREILRFVTGTGKVNRTYVRPLTPLNIPNYKKWQEAPPKVCSKVGEIPQKRKISARNAPKMCIKPLNIFLNKKCCSKAHFPECVWQKSVF